MREGEKSNREVEERGENHRDESLREIVERNLREIGEREKRKR